VSRIQAAAGSAAFVVLGPGLEVVVGPWLITLVAGGRADWPVPVRIIGVALIVAGAALLLTVLVRFVTEGAGTPSPAAPAQRLIVGGAYRHLRHPMYLATIVVVVGEALAFAEPVLLLGAAAYGATFAVFAARYEDRRLAARFGEAYLAYRRAVPGWRPRLRPWTG
jgi:protein-S-isoprenylcysteine O-methyltransferase Ste14